MLLVSSRVPVITWLCSRVMRFQSRPINWPLLTIESPVAQWLEHPTRSRRVVGLNPIWGSDFFRVLQHLIYHVFVVSSLIFILLFFFLFGLLRLQWCRNCFKDNYVFRMGTFTRVFNLVTMKYGVQDLRINRVKIQSCNQGLMIPVKRRVKVDWVCS